MPLLSEAEICYLYRTARDRVNQIEIMAQLNCCPRAEIKEILTRNNETLPVTDRRSYRVTIEKGRTRGGKRKMSEKVVATEKVEDSATVGGTEHEITASGKAVRKRPEYSAEDVFRVIEEKEIRSAKALQEAIGCSYSTACKFYSMYGEEHGKKRRTGVAPAKPVEDDELTAALSQIRKLLWTFDGNSKTKEGYVQLSLTYMEDAVRQYLARLGK